MKSKERINKVYEREMLFIESLAAGLSYFMMKSNEINLLLKHFANVEFNGDMDPQEFDDVLTIATPKILEAYNMYSSFVERTGNLKNHKFIVELVNKEFETDYTSEEVTQTVENAKITLKQLNLFMSFAKYLNKLRTSRKSIIFDSDPIKMFKQIEKVNKSIINESKQVLLLDDVTLYESSKDIFDDAIGPDTEFGRLFSIDELKAEIEADAKIKNQIKKEENASKNKPKLYEIANTELKTIDSELKSWEMWASSKDWGDENGIAKKDHKPVFVNDMNKFSEDVNAFKNYYGSTFFAADELLMEVIIDDINIIKQNLNEIKERIMSVVVYAGEDIRDILREKHSYQIRDYIEKLKSLIDKYDKKLAELSGKGNCSIRELLEAYDKAAMMYALVEEMKANSYVVDIARFSK